MIRSKSALFIVFLIVSLNVISLSNQFSFKKERLYNNRNNNLSNNDSEIDDYNQNENKETQENNEYSDNEEEEISLNENQLNDRFDLMIKNISDQLAEIEAQDPKPDNFDEIKAEFNRVLEELNLSKNKEIQAIKELVKDQRKIIEEQTEHTTKNKQNETKNKSSKEDKEERKAVNEVNKILKDSEENSNGNQLSDFLQLSTTTKVSKASAATYASACLKGVMNSIPPSFCYKKNGDAGKIPTGCPSGWFRSGGLCYKDCKEGYKHVLGVCWQKSCPKGYKDNGLTCFKFKMFKSKTKVKDSYVPSSMNNFDSRIPCPNEHYKSGALCYRNCNKAGLVNCGFGSCASSRETCTMGITTMSVDFILSVNRSISYVLTFGAMSAAAVEFAAARNMFAKTNKKIAKFALENMFTNMMRTVVKNKIIVAAEAYAKTEMSIIGQKVSNNVVSAVCNSVTNRVIGDSSNGLPPTLSLESLDPTGISNAVNTCGSTNTDNEQINCAKSVLTAISTVDITGLSGMAAALIKEVCPWV